MKKRIWVYWPVVLIVPLAAIAWIHAWHTAVAQMPLAADQLSAELARAVSYGLVGSEGPEGRAGVNATKTEADAPPAQPI